MTLKQPTVGRLFKPERRLAKKLGEPGGVAISTALNVAAARMDQLCEKTVEALPSIVADLSQTLSAQNEECLQSGYALSTEIVSLAGLCGCNALSAAADSLADLLCAWRDRRPLASGEVAPISPLFWTAVRVHVDAIATMVAEGRNGSPEGRKIVVAGLKKVAERAQPPKAA